MDDMPLTSTPGSKLQKTLLTNLGRKFALTQLDCISHLLGLDISFDHMQHKIYISTQSKIEELLVKTNMSNATPAATPASGGERFLKSDCANTDEDKKEMAAIPYRSIVASCLWIAINSRPDILFVIVMLAKFCENPGTKHWKQLKRVLRYLAGTRSLRWTLQTNSNFDRLPTIKDLQKEDQFALCGISDADWAENDKENRRSQTGGIVFLYGAPVYCYSVQQKSVALSTMEAESMALCLLTQEIVWWRRLLHALRVDVSRPTPIFVDNEAARLLTLKDYNHQRAKHIDIRWMFTRERVAAGEVSTFRMPSEEACPDFLTKANGNPLFSAHRAVILS